MELHIVNSGQVVMSPWLLSGGDEDYVNIGTLDEAGALTNRFRLTLAGVSALRDELDIILFEMAKARREGRQ